MSGVVVRHVSLLLLLGVSLPQIRINAGGDYILLDDTQLSRINCGGNGSDHLIGRGSLCLRIRQADDCPPGYRFHQGRRRIGCRPISKQKLSKSRRGQRIKYKMIKRGIPCPNPEVDRNCSCPKLHVFSPVKKRCFHVFTRGHCARGQVLVSRHSDTMCISTGQCRGHRVPFIGEDGVKRCYRICFNNAIECLHKKNFLKIDPNTLTLTQDTDDVVLFNLGALRM